jgi:hypothetical protein
MEYGAVIIKYEVIDNGKIVHKGEAHTAWLNSLCDMYLDFNGSNNVLKIYYKDKAFEISSPEDFTYRTVL